MHTKRSGLRAAGAAAALTAALSVAACSSGGNSDSVAWTATPVDYRDAINTAIDSHGCEAVSPDLIAAQTYIETRFTATATSAAGAEGPAQILPAQWNQLAPAVDATDPNNPHDAMAVLVAADCQIANELSAAQVDVTPVTIAAAWNAGTKSVIDGAQNPETTMYVTAVTAAMRASQ